MYLKILNLILKQKGASIMNMKKNIVTALLIAIGYILHQIVPGAIGSMKFDIMLSMIFVSLFINKDAKNAAVTAVLGGVITAMTTTFPGGQLPNIIDKVVTCILVYFMLRATEGFSHTRVKLAIISFIGTLISGTVFLLSALIMVGLPVPFLALFIGIVIPTSITNIFVTTFIHEIVQKSIKASGISLTS